MALTKFGFIVTGTGLRPQEHRATISSGAFEGLFVGVETAADGPDVAREMVDSGIELIELCGGFGPRGTAAVIEAIDGAVPVGSVGYGPESIDAMYALFAD